MAVIPAACGDGKGAAEGKGADAARLPAAWSDSHFGLAAV